MFFRRKCPFLRTSFRCISLSSTAIFWAKKYVVSKLQIFRRKVIPQMGSKLKTLLDFPPPKSNAKTRRLTVSTCIALALIWQQASSANDRTNVLVYLVDKRRLWEETGHTDFTKLSPESLGDISVKVLCNDCCPSQNTRIYTAFMLFTWIQGIHWIPTKNTMKKFM